MSSLTRLVSFSSKITHFNGALSCMVARPQASNLVSFGAPYRPEKMSFPLLPTNLRYFSTTGRDYGKGGMLASAHWRYERIMSVVTLVLIPAAFTFNNPFLDSLMALSIIIHTHWGLEAIVIDYLCRPLIMNKPVSEKWGRYGKRIVLLFSILTLAAVINFNFNDVGITKAVKMLWTLE